MSENKELNSSKQKDSAKVDEYSTFENFDENTHRVRRNLLIFSVIALFYKLSGATLTGKFSFLGLEFDHIDHEMIDLFLFWIVGYHLIHFVWLALEHYQHNIISLTRVGQKDVRGNVGLIYLKDRNWNLFSWWEASYSGIEKTKEELENFLTKSKNISLTTIDSIKGSLINISAKYEYYTKEIKSSLDKFGTHYKNYSLTNRLRWMIIEFGIPFSLGCSAIIKFII